MKYELYQRHLCTESTTSQPYVQLNNKAEFPYLLHRRTSRCRTCAFFNLKEVGKLIARPQSTFAPTGPQNRKALEALELNRNVAYQYDNIRAQVLYLQ